MVHPHLALAADPHDRLTRHRDDERWLAHRWADPASRVLVVAGTRIRPRNGAVAWLPPSDAPDGTKVLLGERDGRTWFAVIAPAEHAHTAGGEWLPLRGLLPLLADNPEHPAPLVMHALGIAEWLWVTRHCPRCGGGLETRAAGHELRCLRCDRSQFPRTDPAVIMLVTAGTAGSADERCLLGRQPGWPEARFSALAGFCEPGETLEDAVRREVAEEVGVRVGRVDYFGNQAWPLPASLMLGFLGEAVSEEVTVDPAEIEQARWFTREQMRAEAEAGSTVLPGGVSISRSLVEHWYGGPLPGAW